MKTINSMQAFLYGLVCLSILGFHGCQGNLTDTRTSAPDGRANKTQERTAERDSAAYELSLRQKDLAEMEASAKRPGVVGVSDEWLNRHNELKEKIITLQVCIHELDEQSKNSN